MMRSRTVREGSVGLLVLLGIMAFGGLILWLRGLNLGSRPYVVNVDFDTTAGMQPGAPVRYRGVVVGRVTRIEPDSNAARVVIEISSTELVIPRDLLVEANQVGLIGETSIDLVPQRTLPTAALALNPRSQDCDADLILCDGAIVNGEVGVSYDTLIRTTAQLADRFDNPALIQEIKDLVTNTSAAAAGIATLTDEVTELTSSLQEDIRFLTRSIEEDLGVLSSAATATVNSVAGAATELEVTATELTRLLSENRSSLSTTLTNLDAISADVRRMASVLTPVLESGELIDNLETLSANAAVASENLRQVSGAFSNADTLVQLQQTLDSAHETFENARKITADLDELTGDPQFRRQIRDLVDGLSTLVSTTEQLEHQTAIAQVLNQAAIAPSTSSRQIQNPSPSPSPETQF